MAHQGEEGVPEAVNVQEDHGFGMQVEPLPGQQFNDLFQRSDATGSDDESIRLVIHQLFAFMHGGHNDGLHLIEQTFPTAEEGGHDANHTSACRMGRAGRGAHQSDPAAAVHKTPTRLCRRCAKGSSCLSIDRVSSIGRAAEQADRGTVEGGNGNGQYGHETSKQGVEDRPRAPRYLRHMSNVVKVGMTRPIVILMLATATMFVAGCGAEPQAGTAADLQTQGWIKAPVIDTAMRVANGIQVGGQALPGSRIVIRGEAGSAFAVVAGDHGRFGLRVPAPSTDALYVVEVQVGEDTIPAAARLLVAKDAAGPVALISPGSPTRRLDHGVGLDVIDSDGRTRVASGRAVAGEQVSVTVNGAAASVVTADRSGRWTLDLGPSDAAGATITVDGRAHAYPGEAVSASPIGQLIPGGDGVGLQWRLSDTAWQTSWFAEKIEGARVRQAG